MLLNSLAASNYRSLNDFEMKFRPFTILIGRNDSGKSNILRVAELLLNDEKALKASRYDWGMVDEKKKRAHYPREITIEGSLTGEYPIRIRRVIILYYEENKLLSQPRLEVFEDGRWREVPIEDELRRYIPRFYYLHPRTGALLEALNPNVEHNIFGLIKGWMPQLKSEYDLDKLMREYGETPDAMTAYNNFLDEKINGPLMLAFPPDFPLIRFEAQFRGAGNKNLLMVRELTHMGGRKHQAIFRLPLSHHGTAFISITAVVVSIAVLQEYHRCHLEGRPMVIALEEPEVHLHPEAQRTFQNYLRHLSNEQQVLITTHSPIFVDRADPKNVVLIRRTKLRDQKSTTEDGGHKPGATIAISSDYRKNWQGVIEELGVRLSDALMGGEINLLVEGPSDAILSRAMANRMVEEGELSIDPDRILVVVGEGKNASNVAISLKGTGNPTIVVLDNDKEGWLIRRELEKQEVRVTEILMVPLTNHLQECELEDILDSEVLLMAFNKAFGTRLGIEFNFQQFREEQLRLRGRGEPHGWVDTVKSLIDQNFASTDSSRKKKRASDLFSKRILAEVAAEYVKCGLLKVPAFYKRVFKTIEEILTAEA